MSMDWYVTGDYTDPGSSPFSSVKDRGLLPSRTVSLVHFPTGWRATITSGESMRHWSVTAPDMKAATPNSPEGWAILGLDPDDERYRYVPPPPKSLEQLEAETRQENTRVIDNPYAVEICGSGCFYSVGHGGRCSDDPAHP